MNIPNILTLIRILISPCFLLLYSERAFFGISPIILPYILLLLVGIFELSDCLDGYIARKYNQVTDLGKILDPMADRLCKISIFLAFTQDPVNVPLILVFLFIFRETIISSLRTLCALNNVALAARYSGKVKTVMQAVVACIILLLMIPHSLGYLPQNILYWISTTIVGIACIYSLLSGAEYIYANKKLIKKILTKN